MAASAKKKVISKEALRRLMKEKSITSKTTAKKIESPLAKYNALGQLYCAVCNTQVKTELLWNAHILSKSHKQNIILLKESKQKNEEAFVPPPNAIGGKKRKQEDDIYAVRDRIAKLQKESKTNSSQLTDSGDKVNISGSLGLGYGSSDESEPDDDIIAPPPVLAKDVNASTLGLPSDFFDSGVTQSAVEETEEEVKPQSMSEKIPEGFFDDPKMDAKVRQVEYRDKMDDEWALFQKAMTEESTVSEAILKEDEEVTTADRIVDEIDDQMQRWSKVDQLAKKKAALISTELPKAQVEHQSDSDIDEEEFEEFLDWRTKKAWK